MPLERQETPVKGPGRLLLLLAQSESDFPARDLLGLVQGVDLARLGEDTASSAKQHSWPPFAESRARMGSGRLAMLISAAGSGSLAMLTAAMGISP